MGRHKADSWLAGLPGCPQSVSRRCVIAAICAQKFYELFVLHLLQPLCHPQTSSSTSVAYFFCGPPVLMTFYANDVRCQKIFN